MVNLIACTDYEQAVQQKTTEPYTDGQHNCGQERAKEKEFTKGYLEAEVRAKNGAGSIGRVLRKQIQMNGPVREKSSQRTEGKGVGKLCWINVPTTRR